MWLDEYLSRAPVQRDGTNFIFSGEGSADWQRRQDESVERYQAEDYNADNRPARMFGQFMAVSIDRGGLTLDIGCGIAPRLPCYVDELGLSRYIGLEPLTVPVEREYLCFVGAVAEDMPLNDASVDAVIFATSFDHIADGEKAISETKRVLKSGGAMFMWQGISDPDAMAEASTLHRLKRGPLTIPLVAAQAAVIAYRMAKRRRDLAQGKRLDAVHERWFTKASLLQAVDGWGFEIRRYLEPPGMASLFVEARTA